MKYTTSPAYSFPQTEKLKLSKIDPLFTPGPQKYSPKKIKFHYPITKIGHAKRDPLKKEPVPGPGSYNIPSEFPKGCKYSIGKSLKIKELSTTPGPGSYRTLTKSRSCLYTFGLKPKEAKDSGVPGPGKYNIRKTKDLVKSSYIFGKEKRLSSSILSYRKITPGPGNYKYSKDAIKIRNPKYSFGKEERKNSEKSYKYTPGPGSYNFKEYIGKESPKLSIPKYVQRDKEINKVGPGEYNKTDLNFYKPKQPSTKIGKKKRFSLSSACTPGPGRYNLSNSITILKKVEPSWKIGTAKRRPLLDMDKYVPGVGKYNLAKKTGKESPKYTIGLKLKNKRDIFTPGPGKYNLDKAYTLEHSPSWKIGTEPKLKNLKFYKNTPGPGAYTINSCRTFRPKFGYTKEKRGYLTINNFPGPGAYHIPCSFEELNTYTRRTGKFNDEFRYV